MPDKGGYARSVLVSFVGVAGMSLLALGNSIVLAHAAGPEGRGLYGLAAAISAMSLPIASAGLGQATTWQLSREQPYAQLLGLTRRAVLVSVVLGMVVAGVAFAGSSLGLDEAAMLALAAAGLALPGYVTLELARGLLLGERRPGAYNLCTVGTVAVLLGLNVWAALQEFASAVWVLSNFVLANWIMAALMAVLSLRRASERPTPELTRSSLRYGKNSAVVALGDAALLRIDLLVAAPFVDLAALGIYAIADQITQIMALAGLQAGKMMLPEAAGDADGQRSLAKLALAVRLLVVVSLLGAAIAAGVGPWVIPWLFGDEFVGAYLAMLLLLPATLFKGVNGLIATWLQGRGDQQPVVRASAVSVVVEAIAVVGLAITVGWLGVALAKTGAYAVQLGLGLAALRRHRAKLPGDDGYLIPGGWWVITGSDVRLVWDWFTRKRRGEGAGDK